MKLLDRVLNKAGFVRKSSTTGKRSFNGAQNTRLTSDWLASYTSADAELKTASKTLMARSRDLERNSEYGPRYLKLVENNVLGACGIGLQMKIADPNGKLDKLANDAIEGAWEEQGKPKNFTVTGQLSRRSAERLILRSAVRDGGALVRIVRGFSNATRYAVQLIERDQLNHDFDGVAANGNEVRMGVEYDSWRRPIAYHILNAHPGDLLQYAPKRMSRVPANDLIHVYMPQRIAQSVGIPWMAPVILPLKMLAGYEEAELLAAREGACKGYFIKPGVGPDGTPYAGETDSRGRELQDLEPGMTMVGEPGDEMQVIDPTHPNSAFPFFIKAKLRGIASALGVSYNSLANDLEGVNYSSIRAGVLEDREEWKAVQEWFVESFEERLFEDWLETQLAFGLIKMPNGSALPASKFTKFNQPEWKPRRWDWVDPLKDAQADVLAIGARLKSRRAIIADDGGDMEAIDNDFANDPVTADLDTKSVYTPNSVPPPVDNAPPSDGKGD